MKKMMRRLVGSTSNELISAANEFEIEREDIVSIIFRDGQFIMFYYQ